ncbi:MAG: hypothetical protein Q4A78_07270 [Peptostreptococcaceae bacterium]|nr:hypothetical protein [Peptostreptococcaceae bacterium]
MKNELSVLQEPQKGKNYFLEKFPREKELIVHGFSESVIEVSEKVISSLKEQELTYEEAYAVLELCYKQLKYESNFITLPSKQSNGVSGK